MNCYEALEDKGAGPESQLGRWGQCRVGSVPASGVGRPMHPIGASSQHVGFFWTLEWLFVASGRLGNCRISLWTRQENVISCCRAVVGPDAPVWPSTTPLLLAILFFLVV